MTFSLLPEFLASRLTGPLSRVEEVAAAVEAESSLEAAASQLRPDIDLPGAIRWTRRRYNAARTAAVLVIGLLPSLLAGCQPTISSLRDRIGVPALVELRLLGCTSLHALPPPLGFGPRLQPRWRPRNPIQQKAGPDPPRDPG